MAGKANMRVAPEKVAGPLRQRTGSQTKADMVVDPEQTRTWKIPAGEFSYRATGLGDEPDGTSAEKVLVTHHRQVQRSPEDGNSLGSLEWVSAEFRGQDISGNLSDLESNWLSRLFSHKMLPDRPVRDRLRFRTVINYLADQISVFLPAIVPADDRGSWYDWLVPLSDTDNSALGPLLAAYRALSEGQSPLEAARLWRDKSFATAGDVEFHAYENDHAGQLDTCPACGSSSREDPFLARLSSALETLQSAVDDYQEQEKARTDKPPKSRKPGK